MRYPLHVYISVPFLLLLICVGSVIGLIGFNLSRDMTESTAEDLLQHVSRETVGDLERLFAPAEMAVSLLSHDVAIDAKTVRERMQRLVALREVLNSSSAFSLVYVGYGSGDFFSLQRLTSEHEQQRLHAPDGAVYLARSIERSALSPQQPPRGRFFFLDEGLRLLREDDMPKYAEDYDPRKRDWYRLARATADSVIINTPPYIFYQNREIGTTFAKRGDAGKAVVAVDILLETLSHTLASKKITPNTQVALLDQDGLVVAHEALPALLRGPKDPWGKAELPSLDRLGIPILTHMASDLPAFKARVPHVSRVSLQNTDWHVSIHPVVIEGASPLYLLSAIPDNELFVKAMDLRRIAVILTIVVILIALPLTWKVAHNIGHSLRKLMEEAETIRRFDFHDSIHISTSILEVHTLALTMDGMKRTIRRFLDITQAVAAEPNLDRLLPMLLTETIAEAGAVAGILYLINDDALRPKVAFTKCGTNLLPCLHDLAMNQAGTMIDAAVRGDDPVMAELTHEDLVLLGNLATIGVITHGVAVPLRNSEQQLIGVIVMFRDTKITSSQLSFIRAFAGSAATAVATGELVHTQKALFEALIRIIASAIDAKNPYTGHHCARVPALAKMIAQAACSDTEGSFKDFQLQERDWDSLHVAAWLHDCGKIITPEHVIDKATKLESICDRIHEIRMRFEVLKRDAEIACLQAMLAGEPEPAARARLAFDLASIDEDFAFVASCNEGEESMGNEKIERLQRIAARTWLRTLDDRIGISHHEKDRRARIAPPLPLPVVETLLADKQEHIVERQPLARIAPENPWGFCIQAPAHEYNKGEVYNLSVIRGTLTDEERYIIKEHMTNTIVMLSQLPLPKHYLDVTEIAGGHHERMDGKGYPRGLSRDELSPLARMMAIADVFEALTAVDRPYKKGKMLSEAIRIMAKMVADHHIDPDWFSLFLRSGVYLEYAKAYVKPEQIDAVDIETCLVLASAS